MIAEGDAAPEFSLPAVVDRDIEEVALTDYLGNDIVILAFYPADFNPSCSDGETDLDELDLFTMQKDVSILGISADSVYSHRAFASEYDLHIPLLSDGRAEVAADYGVAVEDRGAGYLTNRAVVVIDPDGEVQYTWQTENLTQLPPVEAVRKAIDGIGGAGMAAARYRVGHAHYVEGRRAFTKAMSGFSEAEWMMAQNDFVRATTEFEEAEAQFDTAVRFAEAEKPQTYFERAKEKAQSLWQAAEWLAESASAYASGEGAKGQEMRTDAESPLETARGIHEPPDPDDFPPKEDPTSRDEEAASVLPTEDDSPPPTLETGIHDSVKTPEARALADEMTGTDTGHTAPDDVAETEQTVDEESDPADSESSEEGSDGEEIDDEELEEIAAELEEQTKQANAKHEREMEAAADDNDDDHSSIVDEPPSDASETVETEAESDTSEAGQPDDDTSEQSEPAAASDEPDAENVEGELDEGDIELDLADPTDGTEGETDESTDSEAENEDDEDASEELNSGDHGVPDSL